MTFGERLQEIRRERGISQSQLAQDIGVSRQSLSKWENDITKPEVENLICLSRYYGISIDNLLGVETVTNQGETDQGETDQEKGILSSLKAPQNRWIVHTIYYLLFLLVLGIVLEFFRPYGGILIEP